MPRVAGAYDTRASISTGPFAAGAVFAQTTGTCGQRMTITFKLDVP